jgi:hypothetical protein
LNDDQRRNIHQVFRVPMSMTQASDASDPLSSGSTISKDEAKFWNGWVVPEHKRLVKFLNATIMPWLAPGLTLVGDYSEILQLISDTAERRDMWRADVNAGLMTVNRYRVLTGEEPLDDGDVLYISSGIEIVPVDQLGRPIVTEEVIEGEIVPEPEDTPLLPEPEIDIPAEPTEARSMILDEYKAWHNFVSKRIKAGKTKFRLFNHDCIPDIWADETQKQLLDCQFDIDEIDRIFAGAMLSVKSAQSRLLKFQDDFEDWMAAVNSGKLTGQRATNALTNLWTVQGRLMFSEGLIDGGVMDGVPDAEEKKKIQALINKQKPFIRRLRAELAAGNVSDKQRKGKVQSWGNQFKEFWNSGLTSAKKNQMLGFTGDDGKESCRTCQALRGHVHRAIVWEKRELRPGIDHHNYECGTFENCHHILVPVKAKAKGTLPSAGQISAWAAKSCDHDHAHELPPLDQQPYTMEQYDQYFATNGYETETITHA